MKSEKKMDKNFLQTRYTTSFVAYKDLRFNGHPSIDFFNNSAFADLKLTLNAEMKRLQKGGVGSKLSHSLSTKKNYYGRWVCLVPQAPKLSRILLFS